MSKSTGNNSAMPSLKKAPSVKRSARATSRKSKPKVASKRASAKKPLSHASKARISKGAIEVEGLPSVVVDGRRISNYAVIAQADQVGQLAHFAVLSWTPEEYDYESQEYNVPKLYIFRTKPERDEYQQDLYDEQPNTYLQAFGFSAPVRIRSSPPLKRD